ncbi:MAG TPA: MFS transporter [Candidatus Obscuribacterales bacterium]
MGSPTKPHHKPLAPLWIGVAIYFYAFIAIGIAEAGLGVLLPSILVAYNLTPATVTLLFVSQISGYIMAALTSSWVSSRLGLGRMLLLAASLLVLALLTYALSPAWWLMVATGTLLGLGIGLIDAGVNTVIVQDSHTAHLIGMLHGFYGIGALSGPAIATTLLALGMSWRQVYGVLAGLISLLLVGVLSALLYRYPPLLKPPSTGQSPSWGNFRQALQTPLVLLFGAFLLVYVGIEASFSNWAYSVQVIARSTPPLVAGYSVSAYWMGLTLGRFMLGYFLRSLGAICTISMSLILLTIGLLAWWQLPDQGLSLPLIGFALAAIFPAIIWLMPKCLPEALVPAAIGFATSAASVGAALIPTGIGWLANGLGLGMIPLFMLPLAIVMGSLHFGLMHYSEALCKSSNG